MHTYTIAVVLENNNVSHGGAEDVVDILQRLYWATYNINLMNLSTYVASDTCKATVNVAANLDAGQSNCEIHVINLTLGGYGFEIK